MRCIGFPIAILAAVLVGIFLPSAASAQSAMTGLVRDTSGGVLPGVAVEASSPALIEKTRTVYTDAQGRYTVVDLRPGLYKVTFTLQGFSSFVQDRIELPSNFTATINAEMRVGALEESVTVSGASPVVDVQNAQRTTVLSRQLLDAVPVPRMYQAEGALAVGTKVSDQNVGGARAAVNPRLTAHMSVTKDTTIDVDGMKMNTLVGGGDSHPDHNDAMSQEITVQTAALGAEVSAGGPHLNLVPREGGNTFSGATYLGYTGNSFQSDNLSQDLIDRGLRTPDAVDRIFDVNLSLGGPIKRDRLWFFGSHRSVGNDNIVANSFYPDGSPGIYDQVVRNYTLRLTWQVNATNKLTAYDDYQTKYVGHLFTSGQDVLLAAARRPPVLKYTDAVKWTSTPSNKLVYDVGFGTSVNAYREGYQPGILRTPFTPDWFANASRVDIVRSTTELAAPPELGTYNFRYMLVSTLAYVTGSHALKAGMQWHIGQNWINRDANGDLTVRFRDGVPDSVIVYNTPTRLYDLMKADLGLYVQDSWTLKRLTINPGLRWEYFNSAIQPKAVEAGRFVPARSFGETADVPNWHDFAPRFSIVYDLTGDAKTALKGSVNKYNRNYTTDFANRYDPLALQSDTRNWSDCDYTPGTSTCSGRVLPTNGDRIAQDNEIGPSNNRNLGILPTRRADPNIKRPYDIEYSLGVTRELMRGVSVTGAWYRRETYNLEQQINTLVTVNDFSSFTTPNPLGTGEIVTIYNLNRSRQGQVDLLDTTAADRSQARVSYTGLEASFTARLTRGVNLFGGWSADKLVTVSCAGFDPNTFRFCDQSQYHLPFRSDFKLTGSVPIVKQIQVGLALQSYAGLPLAVNWAVPANLFPGGRTQAVTVNLIPPGTQYLDRWTQLDLSFRRTFAIGRYRVDGALDMFNALNSNVVLQQNQNFGSTLGQPQAVLQGRLLRLSTQLKF
ncbi:MAG TPA: carboxypeptidase regulatory-like domain-containing protein [Vicinamibacterales bacterium]|nr:carboxypeptidase regulatory-like domain-containing protein [Vicinamibacterales bacterium]